MRLSMPLPLRTTAVWEGFADTRPIPWCYGRCRIQPVPYAEGGVTYCLADHAIMGVDAATVEGAPVAYAWRNGSDRTGHAIALLELADPLERGKLPVVEMRGARHPITGALLENPADIAWDVLNRAGLFTAAAYWAHFRRQCQAADLVCGGAFTEIVTLRAALDDLLGSVGAVWSAGARGWARLWPSN